MNPKTIHKIQFDKEYSIVPNYIAQNKELSISARGMLVYLLSLPDTWVLCVGQVEKDCGISKHLRLKIFNELKDANHMAFFDVKDEAGRKCGTRWAVFAEPEECKKFVKDQSNRQDVLSELKKPTVGETAPLESKIDKKVKNEENTPLPPSGGSEEEDDYTLPDQQQMDEFVSMWNKTGLPKILRLTSGRKKKLKTRLADPLFRNNWKEVLVKASQSRFLCGENDRNWAADFDWILKNETNFTKVLEGKYKCDRESTLSTREVPADFDPDADRKCQPIAWVKPENQRF